MTIKSQALADFMADFSPSQMTQAEKELQHIFSTTDVLPWILYTDGASTVNGTGMGLVLKSPQGDVLIYSVCCDFKTTNNETEYEALITGLTTTRDMKIKNINIICDSLLIVNHVNGTYEANDHKMAIYLDIFRTVLHSFDMFNIQQVPREQNVQANALAGLGTALKDVSLANVLVVHIMKPASERLKEQPSVMLLDNNESSTNWTHVYKEYLLYGIQPESHNKARTLRMKASRFTIIDDVLFKKTST
ncbi:uncharacterized protein LOC141674625 [Apium graveolens]|uniref:uncharacterized protein LOC141674625 n=1 Tax=Apium graveolens TaxID=4045 RepID=UPI003D79476F